jgi:hypothetical protein
VATVQPPTFTGAFAYEHADIPPGVPIDQYRRERAATMRQARPAKHPARRRLIARLLRARRPQSSTGLITGVQR